ncbi:anthranilate O-methyltransferase 1 [Dendrobium catenatum]|uniref:Benzoate carboxyl methyltransferase n=1 Tax=Dendrobium catenatum TaxID=906689 RepID=A0A2I0VYQ8_9ASPA|nr:anthranilate O-methyltransferase 1 [Dendrobium catenatum]XP_028555188.1 anthranilate O-methyltransferase 1 [Dendrobium catenatum]PKU68547.1 Benzoate carboxyl methyltransferase [Dendrobium catenatum]
MNFEQVFQMLGGGGQTSYAKNSQLQEKAVIRIKPLVEESIKQICKTLPEKLVVADLGCSSGPNTLLVLTQILNAVYEYSTQSSQQKPEIQYFLNDLPNNDFNNIFQLSVQYEMRIREEKGDDYVPFYVVGLPGSFYKRLFPSKSVNIFYSSYSLHWLSQVPKGLEEEGYHLNEKEIYINKGSSTTVANLYLKQFKRDFSDFLKSRSKELIFGGRMILSFLGRADWQSIGGLLYTWGLIAEALKAMVLEGLVEEDKLNAFNLPFYSPSMEEVISVINMEGSFQLEQVQTFDSNWDPFDESNDTFVEDKRLSGKNVSNYIRSIVEPLITSHFGDEIIEDLFSRYAQNIARHMSAGKPKYLVFILFMKLKDEEQAVCGGE